MSDEEKRFHLLAINSCMAAVQQVAEALSGHVLALEGAGMGLPNMRQTAETLAQVALGWQAGEPA